MAYTASQCYASKLSKEKYGKFLVNKLYENDYVGMFNL